jgi:glutamate decarboxylase
MPTFSLTFSRPGSQIVAQYYNFIRLGFDGYRRVHAYSRAVATSLAHRIGDLGPFRLLTKGDELPAFAFALHPQVTHYSVFDVSMTLRERGWLVPAYTFPANREDLAVLRVVVRNGFTQDLADLFLQDLRRAVARLDRQSAPAHNAEASSFAHGAASRRNHRQETMPPRHDRA